MAREVATVDVTLADGRTHSLRYERRHIFRLEKKTGQTIAEVFDGVSRGSYSAMVELTWAGLLHEDPDLEPEDVTELVDFENLAETAEKVSTALSSIVSREELQEAGAEGNPTEEQPESESESGLAA